MYEIATLSIFISIVLILVRLFLGPTLYDRVLAVNSFGTVTVLLIGVLGFLTGRPDFLDIAILYALINFISTIAILKFFRYRALGLDSAYTDESIDASAPDDASQPTRSQEIPHD
ncbi:MAG: multicomponent Na+:H+ antiporter subunit F [Parvibaculaceae bacterium]|jgi:multicomponent Na+:H+ antiporter subunit F